MSNAPLPLEDGIQLLLLEDSPGSANPIAQLLERDGKPRFQVTCAPAAGELGSELLAPAEVILLDLGVADGSSLERVEHVRALAHDRPVVALSLLDDPEMAVAALQRGADDFLHRGQIDRPRLVRRCRYAIERRQMLAQLEAAHERERLERELERLRNDSALRVVAGGRAPRGEGSLAARDGDGFADLAKRYARLATEAVERDAHDPSPLTAEALRALTSSLDEAGADPCDVLDVHIKAVQARLEGIGRRRPGAYADATTLLLLGVLGAMVTMERERAGDAGATGT